MKITRVGVNYSELNISKVQSKTIKTISDKNILRQDVQFKGKHSGAKLGALIFGGMATVGVIAGTLILSGGVAAIPWAAAYIGIGAGSGAIIGHSIDEGSKEFDKNA